MAESNTPELWDQVWATETSAEQDRYTLALERASVRWSRIRERVAGDLSGLRVIEIGAGVGTAAALFAEAGAEVTVLDYSPKALERSKAFFANNGLAAKLVAADALDLPDDLRGAFDICLSLGLAEHFTGEQRVAMIRSHLEVLKPGGHAFISVPNRANPPYRLYKFTAERTGHWKVGEEYPFSKRELLEVAEKAGASEAEVFGESFLGSLYFLDAARIYRRLTGKPDSYDTSRIKPQKSTPLDDFAYALILHARP